MNRIFKYCLLIVTVFISLGIFSQEFKNEEDRKKHADKLFDKGKYVEATPHILHFLSLNQTSPEYNFKYGVCLMYADEDKEKSLRYLKFSASKGGGGDSRVYFFLGKSYHLNYNFKEALKNYQKFKSEGEENYKKDLKVDLHIKMCSNGNKLLQNLTELVVFEKTESSFQRFQYSYDLSQIGGKILVSSEFQSKYDKKQGYQSVVYFPPLNQDILFYSSYGKDGSTGLDLYMVRRAATGGWGDPEKLPESINTPYDDAYGFLHADGNSFYFSSKGHSSMGGYDVFKVDYDAQINKFGTPQNLDYKINTPDDDIMYIVDPNFENAYFSSSRAAKGGYLDVYKVKVETFPIVNVILAGQFENKINPEDIAATIKVENMQSGEIEGIYNPDKAGNYIIVLPRSGKYKFIVETPESEKIHTGIVEVPSQKVVKPLKQSLALVNEGGVEKLVINNQFDQELPNAAEIMAKVLKGMADPEPNADDFPDSLYNVDNSELVTEALNENYSVDDLIGLSADKAKEVQEEATELKKRMEAAFTVANNKSNKAKELTKQADEILKEVESISNPLEKQEKIELAKKAHSQSKDLNMLATTALNLANSLKKEYDKKQEEADDANSVAVAIEKAVNENSHDKAIAALKQLQTRIDSLIQDSPNYKSGYDDIVQRAKSKQEEADKANREAQEYREADDELNLRLSSLERELEKAKKKDQSTIQRQIDDIKEQLQLNDELAKESFEKSARIQKEADVLNHQVDLMSNLYEDIDAGTSVELTDEEKQQVKDYLASNELEDSIAENENLLNKQVTNESLTTNSENENSNNENSNSETFVLSEAEKQIANQELEKEFKQFEEQLSEVTATNNQGFDEKKEVLENWIAALEAKIEETNSAIESSEDENEKTKFQYYLDWLNKQKDTKSKELEELEDSIVENSNESIEVELTENEVKTIETEIKENYESYKEELNTISNNGSEKELAETKKDITESWIEALDNEIMDVEDQLALASTPKEKAEANQKLNLLNEQKSTKEVDLNFIEEEIAAIDTESNNSTTTNEVVELTQNEKEEIIENEKNKFSQFEEKLNELQNNQNPTKEDLTKKSKINVDWINYIDNEINEANNQLSGVEDGIEKDKLSTKLDWLVEQKTIKEEEQSNLTNEIASLEKSESNNSVVDENQIANENQKAEDWLTIIDNDINELEQKINSETDPQKKAELIAQKEKLESLKEEKQNIVETNTSIIEKSSAQKEIESTEEYADLIDEVESISSESSEYKGSLTNSVDYTNDEAINYKNENASNLEELKTIESEISDLQTTLKETKKEKKKVAIQEEIDNKLATQYELEDKVGNLINKSNEAEFNSNQEELSTLLTETIDNDENYIQDENYQLAKLLEQKFIAQNNKANELVKEAGFTENNAVKAEKLKEAHSLQQAAIDNQTEAITLLEESLEEDYEPTYIGEPSNILSDNNSNTEETESIVENEVLQSSYIENKQTEFNNLEEEYSSIPSTEKEAFLGEWKSNIDTEINKNMKLLTSDIPDNQKDVVSENLVLLRSEQLNVRTKQQELETIANNTTSTENENTNTSNEENTNNEETNSSTNGEEVANNTTSTENENTNTSNEENTNNEETNSSTNGEEVANNTTSTENENKNTSNEENTNNEEKNSSTNGEEVANNTTSTENENTNTSNEENANNEETNSSTNGEEVANNTISTENENTNNEEANSSNNNLNVASLSQQKTVFESFENKVDDTESLIEKEEVYNEWISKLEDEIEINEEAVKGNITIEEENLIEEKIEWLEDQLEEKNEELAEIKNDIIEENPTLAAIKEDNSNVSQDDIKNSKVNENVEGLEFYSGKEDLDTYAVSTNTETKELTKNTKFTSEASNEIVENNESTIDKVKTYETTIENLETQKSEASDDKSIASIDKKINKTLTKKSKTEIKLAEDLKEASEIESQLAIEKLEEAKELLTSNVNEGSFEYKQAVEYEEKSEQLSDEASQLRNDAAGTKNVIEKNNKLNEALTKERTSSEYKSMASKLYADAVVKSYKIDNEKITSVSENEEERKSTEIRDAANKADNLAYEYSTRAGELRDSAQTVKKKNKAKVIQEVEVYTQKAKLQEQVAQQLNTEADLVEEKEVEVLENELLLTNLSQSDVKKVRAADNYDEIYAKQLAIEQFLKELKAEEEMMRSYRNLAKQQENKALKYEEKAKNSSTQEEKEKYLEIADKLYEQAEVNKDKQDSIAERIADINEEKEIVEQEQFDLLSLFDEEFQNDIRGLMLSNYDKTPIEKEESKPALALDNLTSSSFEAPEDLTANIVVINNDSQKSVYSSSNPIPLNPKNPKGLVYKVQVGAFRKPIPQDLFKGFAPISAEKIRDDITRYRVGYFVNFETANVSKNQIRGLGYNDAFVVAILNGKRISIAEAREYSNNPNTEVLAVNESDQNITNATETPTNTEVDNTSNTDTENNTFSSNKSSNQENENLTSEENEVPEYVRNLGEDAAEVNAVENIQGLFYTVQVGAFSKPITKSGPFNISPLVTKYVNGLYKYTTGIYKSVRDADGRKNEVRTKGIPDAFVIAYYNGERVSLAKAQQIVQEEGNAAFTNKVEGGNDVDNNVSNNNSSNDAQPNEEGENNNSTDELNENDNPVNRNIDNPIEEPEDNSEPELNDNTQIETPVSNPFENTTVENESNDENLNENTVDEFESEEEAILLTNSYLEDKRTEYENKKQTFNSIPNSEKKEYLNDWNSKLDKDINENMKLLTSNIPDQKKDIISKNLELLRSVKQDVRNKTKEIETVDNTNTSEEVIEDNNTENVIEGNSDENTNSQTDESNIEANNEVEDKSTYYVDLGVYYGTVPTPIAQALLTNKKAKIKRNKINDAATQYYCGVFLTKDDVAEIWASFVNDGLSDAKIVEIEEGEEFILMEKEDQAFQEIQEKEESSISAVDTKLVYRVELGTFKETMPISTGKVFLELGYLGIEKKNYNNKQTYYCGKVDSEAEANELKQKFVDKGISEAKVVAFVGDREISLIEAKELAK